MRGSAVEVKIILFEIFAVVTLTRCQTERPLFQNGILTIPQSQAEYQKLITVADRGQAILTPAISLAAGHVMRQEIPSRSVWAIVLTNCSPRAFADIGSPTSPVQWPASRFEQSTALCGIA